MFACAEVLPLIFVQVAGSEAAMSEDALQLSVGSLIGPSLFTSTRIAIILRAISDIVPSSNQLVFFPRAWEHSMVSLLESLALPGALVSLVSVTATWSNYVSNLVPDAYLVSSHTSRRIRC